MAKKQLFPQKIGLSVSASGFCGMCGFVRGLFVSISSPFSNKLSVRFVSYTCVCPA
jgi:hypothetical protein